MLALRTAWSFLPRCGEAPRQLHGHSSKKYEAKAFPNPRHEPTSDGKFGHHHHRPAISFQKKVVRANHVGQLVQQLGQMTICLLDGHVRDLQHHAATELFARGDSGNAPHRILCRRCRLSIPTPHDSSRWVATPLGVIRSEVHRQRNADGCSPIAGQPNANACRDRLSLCPALWEASGHHRGQPLQPGSNGHLRKREPAVLIGRSTKKIPCTKSPTSLRPRQTRKDAGLRDGLQRQDDLHLRSMYHHASGSNTRGRGRCKTADRRSQ